MGCTASSLATAGLLVKTVTLLCVERFKLGSVFNTFFLTKHATAFGNVECRVFCVEDIQIMYKCL